MSLRDEIATLAQKADRQRDSVLTEEAGKTAFVLPLLKALGYDVFDPHVVIPEFTADVGIKKGEKVDYAVTVNGKIAILFECKPISVDLSKEHCSQLYRYFSVTEARFGVLTNGIEYRFYSDLDQPNKMDAQPFFIFSLLKTSDSHVAQLEKFGYANFDIEGILSIAHSLKYQSLIMTEIKKEIVHPCDELVKMFTKRVYDKNISAAVRERFSEIIAQSFQNVIKEQVSQYLKDALRTADKASQPRDDTVKPVVSDIDVVTTDDELEAFRIIKAISCEVASTSRIFLRDAKSYCAILFDDNNRKPIARLYLSGTKKKNWYIFK